ncbi:MAG: tyrosine-type recombinase/integrase [Beijerinckiaceae bacterium]|nr:tyrosine-type recombinase/integrase [Beijerinckiaceae bacterium]
MHRLPARAVQTITAVGKHADGGGLYLIVTQSGSKNWIFRYSLDGRSREAGLGSARDVSLADARTKAAEHRALIARRIDPLSVRSTIAPIFAQVADDYIRDQAPRWRDPKAVRDWTNSLRVHALALLAMPVDAIEVSDVLALLRPLWQTKPEIASKVRGRIERVLDAAVVLGHRKDNPARWKGGLALVLPPPKRLVRGHHAALPYEQAPAFIAALRERSADSARLLEFLILTAARSGEARGARWSEISFADAVWTIPAERMKAEKEHRVPLVRRALEILAGQKEAQKGQRPTDLVFPNEYGREPSVNVFNALFRRQKIAGITTHGFRSTFRDWAGNETEHAREIIEGALAHAVGDATERAYRRSDALERRRKLMEAWAAYLEAGASDDTKASAKAPEQEISGQSESAV